MRVLMSMMPSTSGEGGSNMQGVPQLLEAVVEVTDFEGEYGGLLGMV